MQDSEGNSVRTFPIQDTRGKDSVPIEWAEEAYKEYATQFGTSQSLEDLGSRGGFGATEIAMLLFQRIKRIQSSASHGVGGDEE
jgi:hypothetical protein